MAFELSRFRFLFFKGIYNIKVSTSYIGRAGSYHGGGGGGGGGDWMGFGVTWPAAMTSLASLSLPLCWAWALLRLFPCYGKLSTVVFVSAPPVTFDHHYSCHNPN